MLNRIWTWITTD